MTKNTGRKSKSFKNNTYYFGTGKILIIYFHESNPISPIPKVNLITDTESDYLNQTLRALY